MASLYKSKSSPLQQLLLGRLEGGFDKFGRATEKIVDKAGKTASLKKRNKQKMGSILAGLLLTLATGGAAAPLLMAGATGLGSYFGGKAGAYEGEEHLESQLGNMGVGAARDASKDIGGSLHEGLIKDALTDAFMSYAGGKLSTEGIKGLMPKTVPTVSPTTGATTMTKQGLPSFNKLPTAESVGGQKLIETQQKLLTPKIVDTPGFLEKIFGDKVGDTININPFVKEMPFDFSQLSQGGGVRGNVVPTMFGEGIQKSLPMILPQLISMYEGRR